MMSERYYVISSKASTNVDQHITYARGADRTRYIGQKEAVHSYLYISLYLSLCSLLDVSSSFKE